MNIDEIITASLILFAVIDIVGSVPIILEVKQRAGTIKPVRTTLISGAIMLGVLFAGEQLIGIIGIDINSFAVAGAFVLFFLALEMILGVRIFRDDDTHPNIASVVPLAFPLIAGAGTLTTLLSMRAAYAAPNIVAAICVNMVLVYVVLRNTARIEGLLGPGGIAVLKKVFGIILLALAVKLFSQNIAALFKSF